MLKSRTRHHSARTSISSHPIFLVDRENTIKNTPGHGRDLIHFYKHQLFFIVCNLSIMNDEKLIETVRKYPVIYDSSNRKYMDPKYKRQVWKRIGTEINQSG